ncbi:MAG: rod-binding protein [Limnochordaceae bacterium]|nr:rod-binding protein [Limnochordaceae bacterium]
MAGGSLSNVEVPAPLRFGGARGLGRPERAISLRRTGSEGEFRPIAGDEPGQGKFNRLVDAARRAPLADSALPELIGENSDAQQLRWTATQLEAMLLREVLRSALPNGLSSGLAGKGLGSQFYDSLLLDEWARTWAESGGVGLAEALIQQLQGAKIETPGKAIDKIG